MPKYYSTGGDQGITGVLGNNRVPKDHPLIQAVGAVDEATEALGFARALADDPVIKDLIKTIQADLLQIMSQLVLENPDPEKYPDLDESRLDWVETTISGYEKDLTPQEDFILPGDSILSAAFGLARVNVRRAEREVVRLKNKDLLSSTLSLPYLNRLSSLCFVLELFTSDIQSSPIDNKK